MIRSRTHSPFRRTAVLAAALALFLSLLVLPAAADGESMLSMSVNFDENLFFSKYDAEVYLDGVYIATILHGQAYSGSVAVADGAHTLTFYRVGHHTIFGSEQFLVDGDTSFQCTIHAYNTRITVRNVMVVCANSQAADPVYQVQPPRPSFPGSAQMSAAVT